MLRWANTARGARPGKIEVFSVGQNRGMCAVADADGNGNLDVSTGINLLLGDGVGGFGAPLLRATTTE